MMRTTKLYLGLLFCMLSGISMNATAANSEIAANVISIKTPTVNEQALNNNATEVFMAFLNQGHQSHELVAATSPMADQVQLHTTAMQHGKMVMQQIQEITIKTNHEKDLQLGGLHVMLIGLKGSLAKNQSIPITLIFNDGSWKTIHAKIT